MKKRHRNNIMTAGLFAAGLLAVGSYTGWRMNENTRLAKVIQIEEETESAKEIAAAYEAEPETAFLLEIITATETEVGTEKSLPELTETETEPETMQTETETEHATPDTIDENAPILPETTTEAQNLPPNNQPSLYAPFSRSRRKKNSS